MEGTGVLMDAWVCCRCGSSFDIYGCDVCGHIRCEACIDETDEEDLEITDLLIEG